MDLREGKFLEWKISGCGILHWDFSVVRHFCWVFNEFSVSQWWLISRHLECFWGCPHSSSAFTWWIFLYSKPSLPLSYNLIWYSVSHRRGNEIAIMSAFEVSHAETKDLGARYGSVMNHLFGLQHGISLLSGITCPSIYHSKKRAWILMCSVFETLKLFSTHCFIVCFLQT